jgi:dTDP-4-amino-4,6-dideoxygalactose transaminase
MTPEFIKRNKMRLVKQISDWLEKASKYSVFGSSIFGGGDLRELENLFCKVFSSDYAIALSSGSSAIHTALVASGIKKSSKVLLLNNKWDGIDGIIKFHGSKPIRVNYNTKNIEGIIHKLVKDDLKVIIVTRSIGDKLLMKKLEKIITNEKLFLIEDFADLKIIKAKTVAPECGDFALFSLGYNKWIQAGEGGILLCNNFEYYTKAVQFTQHPIYQRARLSAKLSNPVSYGLNYRMNPLTANLALYQLKYHLNYKMD